MVCEECVEVEHMQLEVVSLKKEIATMKEHMEKGTAGIEDEESDEEDGRSKRLRKVKGKGKANTSSAKKGKPNRGYNCAVPGCRSKQYTHRHLSFHRLPADKLRARKWIEAIKDPLYFPSKRKRICARHFAPDCFEVKQIYGQFRRTLGAYAMPTRFPYNNWGQGGYAKAVPFALSGSSSESEHEETNQNGRRRKKYPYSRCCIPGCTSVLNSVTLRTGSADGISFHRFPADKIQREDWLTMVGIKDWVPEKKHVVCSLHFVPGLIERVRLNTSGGYNSWRSNLAKGAVPTLFPRRGEPWPPESTDDVQLHGDELEQAAQTRSARVVSRKSAAQSGGSFYDEDGESDDSDYSIKSEDWAFGLPVLDVSGNEGEFCIVPGCESNPEVSTLFPFPPPGRLREAWLSAIGQDHLIPKSFTRVCLDHFAPDDLEYDAKRNTYLLQEGAIPTIIESH